MKKISFKILFIVLTVILVGAAGLVIALTTRMSDATANRDIQTAVSESNKQMEATPTASLTSAAPEAAPSFLPMSAETLRRLVVQKERRRSFVIPSLDNVVTEAKTWESIEPENYMKLKGEAFIKTVDYAEKLFGYETTDATINFWYYTDTSKKRGDIVKVAYMDDTIVCTLAADTLDLIEIDYYFAPAKISSAYAQFSKDISDSSRQIADKVAASFDTGVLDISLSGCSASEKYGYGIKTYNLTMENGKFVKIATLNDELYAVGVYPTKACMTECVYFEADVQRDESIIRLASPRNFAAGEPGKGDMTKAEALSIYKKFLNLANGTADYPDPAAVTFYIDRSGTRENYWHIGGELLTMDVASKSKWLVSLKCSGLWNPDKDLTKIPYGSMGGSEYEAYVENIMSGIYGDSLTRVTPNAVYDYHYCTEDAVMADGTWYEFYFEDGKLMEVWYFYNEECFRSGPSGWKADNTYINSTTGEEFIPQ